MMDSVRNLNDQGVLHSMDFDEVGSENIDSMGLFWLSCKGFLMLSSEADALELLKNRYGGLKGLEEVNRSVSTLQ